ncbi:MAG: peptidoglycan DD-metalloendopeptidase family protein [Dinoroseobacter sp.]|nr:peptidoglycan DD-metalloendopeptidase family protein [Dinoroseobacter sp.]
MRLRACVICALLLIGGGVADAQTSSNPALRAEEAVGQLDMARALLEAAPTASDRVAALTQAVRGFETGLTAIRESARIALIREQAILAGLEAEQERLGELLGVLQTISRTPDPVLLMHPEGPLGLARAGMLISDVTPAVAAEAERLSARLRELEDVRGVQTDAEARLAQALVDIQTARTALAKVISERVRLPDGPAADPVLLGVLSASSTSLREFAEGLSSLDLKPAPTSGFVSAKGSLPLPVAGNAIRGFGQADLAGIERSGIVVATEAQALVTAPSAATVRYVGTLLDYGIVVILEPQADYLLIMSGLNEVFVQNGEVVTRDAPLGLMGGDTPAFDRADGGQMRQETLYMELRDSGEPVDPAEWFVIDSVSME